MQKPPTDIVIKDQRPGFLEFETAVNITGTKGKGRNPSSTTSLPINHSGQFGIQPGNANVSRNFFNTRKSLAEDYQTRTNQLPQIIENELAATRLEGPTNPVPPIEGIIRELGVLHRLWVRKQVEFSQKTIVTNSFYGYDPIDRPWQEFSQRAKEFETPLRANGVGMQVWTNASRAAYDLRLLTQTIQTLNQRSINLQHTLAALQAAEQARVAAEQEAQRVAAEQARIRAEAEAKAHAQEQARLAALAEAERVAGEQARIAAEAAAQYIAAERARLEAEAEVQRQAEQLRQENERLAEEQAFREAMESLNAGKGIRPFPVSGAAAANGPVFAVGAGTLAVETATALAIRTALSSAIATAITASAAAVGVASGAVIVVGVAALVYHALRDNNEPYALSVPLSDLTTYDADQLRDIAQANGDIELPVALGSRTVDNSTEFFVAATNGTTVPRKVPVRPAIYDPGLNLYRTESTDAQSPGMTWTPIVSPGDASTALPVTQPDVAPYTGATATPLEGRIDPNPELDLYSFGVEIYVFPPQSGIPPLYVVFNSPYEGAVVEGEHSGRDFNPDQSGGPTLNMNWNDAVVSQEGSDIVKLHTSKFIQSDANKVMIDRLDRIFRGELEITDTDKRFYTHEIREFERFKALGYGDTEMPDPDSPVWNNVHTATLEDFKLKDDLSLLYTPEALAAAAEQDERDYQRFLKEMLK
ncbi:S-type pyocin domain-containing protein [Pseudomonas izuensis]|uniref:S-type pyocin domain-containing protein n=1 Tax=Pseudomonas izuensis TaxID=2684212 RepID=UPI001FE410F1|nr:S-type pyocin domain-containing protein [Pseudomonas izuensis]